MRVRFLADADLHPQIVLGLKRIEPEIDFETAQAAALRGVPDPEVLRIAAEKNRVLVSHDRRTMPSAFYPFLNVHRSSGLILISQSLPIGRAIEELQICYHALEPEEFAIRYSTYRYSTLARIHVELSCILCKWLRALPQLLRTRPLSGRRIWEAGRFVGL